ncbi:MAG: response regulator transcription factor [Chitinophagales bacterium]|nr:response regulator transcription factor [Chitinophagales bacterium]
MKKIAIVEDKKDVAHSIQRAIENTEGLEFSAYYLSAEAALNGIPNLIPDIIIMDIGLPKMNGIDCMLKLKQKLPNLSFLMFTVFDNDEKLFNALRYGADGYILKSGTIFDVIRAVKELIGGGAPMSRDIARRVLLSHRTISNKSSKEFEELTPRQNEVVKLIAEGKLNKEIADILGIKEGTVRQHNYNIYKKLHVNNRTEVAKKLRDLNKGENKEGGK